MPRHYHVGKNIPGYLPESDVDIASDADEAKRLLIAEIDSFGDSLFEIGEKDLADASSSEMQDLNLTDVTDGYSTTLRTSSSEHDLGMAFWINPCDEEGCDEDDD